MDWQQPAALAVVALTGFLWVRHEIRARRKARSRACGSADCACGSGAGKSITAATPPAADVESHT